MPFRNPLVSGTALARSAINSPGYTPGTTGWTINRDGSAEFADVVIRGGELLITDPDGSFVRIYDEDPGDGAVVELQPADQVGETFTPARLRGYSTAVDAGLIINGPATVGSGITLPQVFLEEAYGAAEPYSAFGIVSDAVEWNLSELGFAIENAEDINNGASFSTTSASFVPITGAPTITIVKARTRTRLRLDMTANVQIDNAGTGLEIGLRLTRGVTVTDVFMARWYLAAVGSAGQSFPVTGHAVAGAGATLDDGTYIISAIMRRYTGGANCIWPSTALGGWMSFTAAEVAEEP